MAIFESFGKFFKKSAQEPGNYLSLTIGPDRVVALIWTFEGSLVKTLGFAKKSFKNADVLLHQTAVAIDTAGEQAKVDVSKTVFGLSQNWLEGTKLATITTKTLKKLSDELELSAQAYVSLAASINHYLKIEEQITPQVVAIGIFGDLENPSFCEVHLIEKNKVVVTKTSQSPINLEKIQSLVTGLKQDEVDLPAKIVVFGIDKDSDFAQKIAKNNWQDTFIHEPKIDFIDDNQLARAVAYAQAADALGYEPVVEQTVAATSQQEIASENQLGFVPGKDILLEVKDEEISTKMEKLPEEPEKSPPTGGQKEEYAVEVSNLRQPASVKDKLKKPFHTDQIITDDQIQYQEESKGGIFTKLFSIFSFSQSGKKLAIIVLVIIVLLTAGIYIAAQTQVEAKVRIIVVAKPFEDTFSAQVSTTGTFDASKSQISGNLTAGKAEGNQKAVTTGSKKVGDPARGEVTVFNWTTSPKKFSVSEGIISKNGLKFTLDAQVQVASRSASTPGETKANITSSDLGPTGNLPAGTDFTFQQFDELSYSAVADTDFSGGTERQVTVVTQDDLTKLEKSLTETLFQKAKEDLKTKASDKKIADEVITLKIITRNFDQTVDDEAPLVNLTMQVEAQTIVFDENELKKLITETAKSKFDQNLEAKPQNMEIKDLKVKKDENKLSLSGRFLASLVPKTNEDDLKSRIAGKSIKEARSIIKENQAFSDVIVDFSPNIPILSSIPKNKDKIKFKFEIS